MRTEPYLDKDNARRHRQLQKRGGTNRWWEEQARMLEGSPLGKKLPARVKVGELPQVNVRGITNAT